MGRPRKPYFCESNGWWMSRFNGEYQKLAKGRENKEEALRRFHELNLLESIQKPQHISCLTVAAIIEKYLAVCKKSYSPSTFENRLRYLQEFAEAHGWRPVNDRDCLPIHLEEWIDEHDTWQSDWTRGHVIAVVLRPFNWAVKKRLIPTNPFRGAEKPVGDPRRPLTDQEFCLLLRSTCPKENGIYPSGRKVYPSDRKKRKKPSPGARFRQVLFFLRLTGARPGELCNLQWEDIDLDNKVIILRQHKTSKKTHKPRVIPLHPVIVKLLIYIRRLEQNSSHVFLNHRTNPWNKNSLSQRMQRARKAVGIASDAKLYGLRHGFGTRAVLNGVDIKTLAELMGHTSTRTTEHYLHLAGHREHLAASMLQANARNPGS